MRIEEFIENPIEALIKAERYVNDGSPSGIANTTSMSTCPKSVAKTFNVIQVTFPKEIEVKDVGVIKSGHIQDNSIYIHPDMLDYWLLQTTTHFITGELVVSPTASGRTVLATNEGFFVKLAYSKQLGRLTRHLGEEKLNSAHEVTQQLVRAVETGMANPQFAFLREDYGRVAFLPINDIERAKNDKVPQTNIDNGKYEMGCLFRELKPFPYIKETEHLIPFFSLFGHEYSPTTQKRLRKQGVPLVIQLFEKQDKPIEEFITRDLIFPLLHAYFDALLLGGVELEAHAQNMLLTIDSNFKVKRIVCRDLESAGRDATLMDYLKIQYTHGSGYKYNVLLEKEVDQKYAKWYITHSFMFDFKLGEYIITPLLATIKKHFPCFDKAGVIKAIRLYNKQFIDKLPIGFFPKDWCTYKKVNFEQQGLKREYDWHSRPRYR